MADRQEAPSAASPSQMQFYLGSHHASQRWFDLDVPLFASRRVFLRKAAPVTELIEQPRWEPGEFYRLELEAEAPATKLRKTLPRARTGWALDSGGFTELSMFGGWRTTAEEYVRDVQRLEAEVGMLDWVAPQDWMCEPHMLEKTGLTVLEHQRRTVQNFLALRQQLGELVIPVLQGWTLDDYLFCWDMYADAGVNLLGELVGLGSVCRRQNTAEAGKIARYLFDSGLSLHYFGAKITGLGNFSDALTSADSMAWSYRARHDTPLPGCTHKSCANCPRYAMRWRDHLLNILSQERLEIAA